MYSQRWADRLQAHRHTGDALADQVIDRIFQEQDLDQVNQVFMALVRNEDVPTEQLPPFVQDYLNETQHLPDWADPALLEVASGVFDEHGPVVVMMLFGASLPVLYAARPGAQVLIMTQRMTKHLDRRIFETAQFVLDVTAPNAFTPQGRGIRTTQKVRLMHAAIRHLITHDPRWRDKWDMQWGIPINQADLAGTMMSFSTTIIHSLIQSDIALSPQEQEGYLHLWKVVGHILGIHQDLMPANYADALDMMDTWMQLYHAPSEAGTELTKVLTAFVQKHVHILPTLVTDSMRFWIGSKTADMLGVPGYQWTVIVLQLQRWLWAIENRLDHDIPILGRLSRFASRLLLEGMLDIERGGTRAQFRIPRTLRERLGVSG